MNKAQTIAAIKSLPGMQASRVDGEWRVTHTLLAIADRYPALSAAERVEKAESLAYYTDDAEDALGTAQDMSARWEADGKITIRVEATQRGVESKVVRFVEVEVTPAATSWQTAEIAKLAAIEPLAKKYHVEVGYILRNALLHAIMPQVAMRVEAAHTKGNWENCSFVDVTVDGGGSNDETESSACIAAIAPIADKYGVTPKYVQERLYLRALAA